MRTSRKIASVVAIAGLVALGGSAFTETNSQAVSQEVGYGTTTITGATVNSMVYNLNAGKDHIDSLTLVLATDTTLSSVFLAYNAGTAYTCGVGVFTTVTTYTCDNNATAFVTESLTATHIIVTS